MFHTGIDSTMCLVFLFVDPPVPHTTDFLIFHTKVS